VLLWKVATAAAAAGAPVVLGGEYHWHYHYGGDWRSGRSRDTEWEPHRSSWSSWQSGRDRAAAEEEEPGEDAEDRPTAAWEPEGAWPSGSGAKRKRFSYHGRQTRVAEEDDEATEDEVMIVAEPAWVQPRPAQRSVWAGPAACSEPPRPAPSRLRVVGERAAPRSRGEMQMAPPVKAAAFLREAEDGDYEAWNAVWGKVWGVFQEARCPCERPQIYHLEGVGPVAKVRVEWAPEEEQETPEGWQYEYARFHATTVECLQGILTQRGLRAGDSGVIYCVALLEK
jgi:hypothetical protein